MINLQVLRQKFLRPILLGVLVLLVGSVVVGGLAVALPPAVDWHTAFRPAALKLVSGRSPYEVEGFFNPFWGLIPLIPLAIFPEPIGRAMLFVVSLLSFLYVAHRFGAKLLAILFVLLSPPAMHGLLNGNIDWLVLLGLVVPPWIGLFFVSVKPQMGAAIALFWVVEAWRQGGWRQVVRLVWPFTVVFLFSLLIFGLWPLRSTREIDLWWNASLWPVSIPVGLALLTTAFRKRKINYALGASPCLSPYVLLHSWIIALFAIVTLLPETIVAVVGLWIVVIIRLVSS